MVNKHMYGKLSNLKNVTLGPTPKATIMNPDLVTNIRMRRNPVVITTNEGVND